MDSNGYIMLDFSPIDFSKKNQVIYGLFDRISDVKAVNKFIIILNIQGNKTPLPAVMTYINNSYVIESFLYNFTITSDDNIRIDNVSADIIKDGIISAGSTWSSNKINEEISKLNIIDDDDVSDNTTWSSDKIQAELNNIPSGYEKVLLYENTSSSYVNQFNNILDVPGINDYDFLLLDTYIVDVTRVCRRLFFIPKLKNDLTWFTQSIPSVPGGGATQIVFMFNVDDVIDTVRCSTLNNGTMMFKHIWGINF